MVKSSACLQGVNSVLSGLGEGDIFINLCPPLGKCGEERELFLYVLFLLLSAQIIPLPKWLMLGCLYTAALHKLGRLRAPAVGSSYCWQ